MGGGGPEDDEEEEEYSAPPHMRVLWSFTLPIWLWFVYSGREAWGTSVGGGTDGFPTGVMFVCVGLGCGLIMFLIQQPDIPMVNKAIKLLFLILGFWSSL